MVTITEDYVSFETAKLLEEKGFDEQTRFCFRGDGKILHNDESYVGYPGYYPRPTLQMAMKWLRKVHNLCLFVIPATIDETFRTGYALYPQCDSRWEWCASKNDRSKATFGFNINKKYCDSHEEACETVIKYCLENLI